MSYGILSKNAFVQGGYVLGDFAIGDSVLDSRDYRQTNTIDLTKIDFNLMYFFAVYLNALLLVRGYRLSNCIDQHKTWPTSLNYFTIVSFCNVLDCSVLFCSSFDYSSLNSSVL